MRVRVLDCQLFVIDPHPKVLFAPRTQFEPFVDLTRVSVWPNKVGETSATSRIHDQAEKRSKPSQFSSERGGLNRLDLVFLAVADIEQVLVLIASEEPVYNEMKLTNRPFGQTLALLHFSEG
jgi:hypothetical protein